jgi:hypothetical protein
MLIFLPNRNLDHMHNQVDYHPSKFQLENCSNKGQIVFQMNLGLLTQVWNCFHHSPLIARIGSQRRPGFTLSTLVSMWSLRTFYSTIQRHLKEDVTNR